MRRLSDLTADLALPNQKQRQMAAVAFRASQVRERYKQVIEFVYTDAAQMVLDHTNSVYIFQEDDVRSGKSTQKAKKGVKPAKEGVSIGEIGGDVGDGSDHGDNPAVKSQSNPVKLVVYVDESIFAAELNAQREFILLTFQQLFSEKIDTFDIKISRGMYRKNHPFKVQPHQGQQVEVELTPQQREYIEKVSAVIKDDELRQAFKKAMESDLSHVLPENGNQAQ